MYGSNQDLSLSSNSKAHQTMKRKWKAPTGESAKELKSPHVDDFSAQNNNTTVAKEGGSSGFGDSFNPRGRPQVDDKHEDTNFTRERGLFSSELNDADKKAVVE